MKPRTTGSIRQKVILVAIAIPLICLLGWYLPTAFLPTGYRDFSTARNQEIADSAILREADPVMVNRLTSNAMPILKPGGGASEYLQSSASLDATIGNTLSSIDTALLFDRLITVGRSSGYEKFALAVAPPSGQPEDWRQALIAAVDEQSRPPLNLDGWMRLIGAESDVKYQRRDELLRDDLLPRLEAVLDSAEREYLESDWRIEPAQGSSLSPSRETDLLDLCHLAVIRAVLRNDPGRARLYFLRYTGLLIQFSSNRIVPMPDRISARIEMLSMLLSERGILTPDDLDSLYTELMPLRYRRDEIEFMRQHAIITMTDAILVNPDAMLTDPPSERMPSWNTELRPILVPLGAPIVRRRLESHAITLAGGDPEQIATTLQSLESACSLMGYRMIRIPLYQNVLMRGIYTQAYMETNLPWMRSPQIHINRSVDRLHLVIQACKHRTEKGVWPGDLRLLTVDNNVTEILDGGPVIWRIAQLNGDDDPRLGFSLLSACFTDNMMHPYTPPSRQPPGMLDWRSYDVILDLRTYSFAEHEDYYRRLLAPETVEAGGTTSSDSQ